MPTVSQHDSAGSLMLVECPGDTSHHPRRRFSGRATMPEFAQHGLICGAGHDKLWSGRGACVSAGLRLLTAEAIDQPPRLRTEAQGSSSPIRPVDQRRAGHIFG